MILHLKFIARHICETQILFRVKYRPDLLSDVAGKPRRRRRKAAMERDRGGGRGDDLTWHSLLSL